MQFDLWMPVPNWLGGTWQASSEVVLYSYNYREQRNVVDEPMTLPINRISTIGAQRDSSGQIWHYTGAPYIRSIDTPNYIEHQQIDRLVLLNTSAHLVTTRCLATVTHVDRSTDETLDKFIEQTTTTYEPLSEGVLQVTFLVNDFDMHDRPRNSSKSVCTETRVKPFQPVDQDERGNLRYLFNQFEKLNRYFTK
jgi:hypothetical protein